MPVSAKLDSLIQIAQDAKADAEKADLGNNAATARVRGAMMEVRTLAQEIRMDAQAEKNARSAAKKSSG